MDKLLIELHNKLAYQATLVDPQNDDGFSAGTLTISVKDALDIIKPYLSPSAQAIDELVGALELATHCIKMDKNTKKYFHDEIKHFDAVLAAHHSNSYSNNKWKPIETAPKDGTTILGYYGYFNGPDDNECHTVCYMANWFGEGRGSWVNSTGDNAYSEPRAWLPLPTAPNPDKEDK